LAEAMGICETCFTLALGMTEAIAHSHNRNPNAFLTLSGMEQPAPVALFRTPLHRSPRARVAGSGQRAVLAQLKDA
jgi:hypothetical protein